MFFTYSLSCVTRPYVVVIFLSSHHRRHHHPIPDPLIDLRLLRSSELSRISWSSELFGSAELSWISELSCGSEVFWISELSWSSEPSWSFELSELWSLVEL